MRKFLPVVCILVFSCFLTAFDRQPNADYRARREALAKKAGGIVVLFAPAQPFESLYRFRQDDDFFYLTGAVDPDEALLLAPAVEAKENVRARAYTEILFLPPRNPRLEKYTGPKLGAENPDAPAITGVERVAEIDKLPEELAQLLDNKAGTVYSDLPAVNETSPSSPALPFLKRTSILLSFADVKPLIASLRMIKDAGEIGLLQKAVDASVAAHLAAMKAVKPNVTEYEIAALMGFEWERRGCERASYPAIVGSGHNSTVLHYSEDTNTMKGGDVVVIDAAGEYSMYAADITRTLPVNGHFSARQKEIYDIVWGAQQAAMAAFQSGKSLLFGDSEASLTRVAKDYIKAHGKDLHGQALDQYFIHGLGHYLGLDVHDAGDYKVPLGPGMAFTIEPGIYIPEENIGVRIEDDYLVGADGRLIKLSSALPSRAEEVEKAMTGN
jgi:Xaa-Pro aminopeptidase